MKVQSATSKNLPTRPLSLNSQLVRSCIAFLTVFLIGGPATGIEQPLAESTVIVYNKAAADSAELARFYAQQRGIAFDHIVGLDCSVDEEITRAEYDMNIAAPLRETFKARGWWTLHEAHEGKTTVLATSIRFVAVIKGVPLKIKPLDAPYEGDQPVGGPVGTPAHCRYKRGPITRVLSWRRQRAGEGARQILTNDSAFCIFDELDDLAHLVNLREFLPDRFNCLCRIIFGAI